MNDCTQAIELLGQHKAEAVLANKGYDADAIVEHVEAMVAKAVIPSKRNRKVQRDYDIDLYKQRDRIERCFSKLEDSPHATNNPRPASKPSPPSPAPGFACSYMSIRPRILGPPRGMLPDRSQHDCVPCWIPTSWFNLHRKVITQSHFGSDSAGLESEYPQETVSTETIVSTRSQSDELIWKFRCS